MRAWCLFLVVLILSSSASHAESIDCMPLRPTHPRDTSEELTGRVDAAVGGFLSKFIKGDIEANVVQEKVEKDVLSRYSNANSLFIKERALYVLCEDIAASSYPESLKEKRLEQMMLLASEGSGHDYPAVNQSSHGNKSPNVIGNGNNIQ